MTYAPPPVPASAGAGKPRLRGRIPLRLAIIFLILGIAGIAVGAVIAYNGALKKVNDFQRITIPQNGTGPVSKKINFGGTGGFIAYYESKNANIQPNSQHPNSAHEPDPQAAAVCRRRTAVNRVART